MRPALLLGVLGVLALAGCSSGGAPLVTGPAVSPTLPPVSYVAVGASETVGYGADDPLTQSWPQVLFHTALPTSTTFVNLGIPGETVREALTDEVPQAVSLHPDLVTVWLNVNDGLAAVPAAVYEAELDQLVHLLRRGGRTAVLVANTPPLSSLPAYLACIHPGSEPGVRCRVRDVSVLPDPAGVDALVASYNTAIAAVCRKEGAVLVDLHSVGADPSFIGSDGFHPSTAGHKAVAAAFAAAVKRVKLP